MTDSTQRAAPAASPSPPTPTPIVSIGIPTYNRPAELRRALNEVVNQTYHRLEIIVSDNATPGDEVGKIVQEFMARDSRIRFFRQPSNIGALHNFQFVLEQASGEYFLWAADDDWRYPTFVERLVGLLREDPNAALAFCAIQAVDAGGANAPHPWPEHSCALARLTHANAFVRCVRFLFQSETFGKANMIYGLFRRRDLERLDWPQFVGRHGQLGADILFLFKTIQDRPPIVSDELLYRYTVDNRKHYYAEEQRRTIPELVGRFALLIHRQLKYLSQYHLLASSLPLKLVTLLFIPWKFALLLFEDAQNIAGYVRRHSVGGRR